MSNEKSRRPTENAAFGWKFPVLPDAGRWMDAYRQQYEIALEVGDVMLAGLERLQSAQLEAAKEIQAQNRRSADALTGVTDMRAMMSAQGALASAQWQAAMRQLSGMAEIVQKTNLDCARIVQSRCGNLGEGWKGAATPQFGTGDMPAAWKSAMDAARMSGETMMKALTGQGSWLQAAGHNEPQKAKAA